MLRTSCLARLLSCNSIKKKNLWFLLVVPGHSEHRMREKHQVLDKVLLRRNNLSDRGDS